ncbi:hypothetical protein C3K47_16220, partial [Solitalea longa]
MVKKFTLSTFAVKADYRWRLFNCLSFYVLFLLFLFSSVLATAQTVSISNATAVNEGNTGTPNTLSFTVSLDVVSPVDIVVGYDFTGSSATPSTDFVNSTTTVTIPANSLTATISVPVKGDLIDEPNELVQVNLTGILSGSATIAGSPSNSATGQITDDDATPVISISNPANFIEANSTLNFPVTLSNPSSVDLTLSFSYSGTAFGGAAADPGVDYNNTITSIVIPAGSTSATIPIITFNDRRDEDNETIIITLNSVTSGASIAAGAARIGTAQIIDNDGGPKVGFEYLSSSYIEGVGTAVTIRVKLTGNTTERLVTVPYTISGTALQSPAANFDYQITANASPLVFNGNNPFAGTNGQRTKDITLIITNDNLVELNETVVFTLGTPLNSSAVLGNNKVHTLTILNDDAQISIQELSSTIAEGTGGGTTNFTFVVKRDGDTPIDQPIDFTYTVSPNGASPADAADFSSGFPINVSATIPANQSSVVISIPVNKDPDIEPSEGFSVQITPQTGVVTGTNTALGVIQNDDNAVSLEFAATSINEGTNTTLFARIPDVLPLPVTVTVAVGNIAGSAVRGTDYTVTAGTLTFTIPAGSTVSNSYTIAALNDNIFEGTLPETLIASITSVTNATAGAGAILAINDIQTAPTVSISANNLVINEIGAPTQSIVTVTLSTRTYEPVTVDLAVGITGTALIGDDYTVTGQTVTIPAGSLSATVTITAINDGFYEGLPNETADVNILAVKGGAATESSSNNNLTVQIVDSTPLPVIRIASAPSIVEGASGEIRYLQYTYTLENNRPSATDIQLNYSFSGTASGGNNSSFDYDNTTTQVLIEAGQTTGTILVPVYGDNISEIPSPETVIITLQNGSGYNVSASPNNTATGNIIEDDQIPTVSLVTDFSFVREPGAHSQPTTARIRARLSNSDVVSASDITVQVNLSGTAANGADYTTVITPITLTIPAGLTESDTFINIGAITDNLYESFDETVIADISSVSNNAQIGVGTQVNIIDNDPAPLLTINDVSTTEGNAGMKLLSFTVTKTGNTALNATVNYFTVIGTATTTDADFVGIAVNTITLLPNQTSATVNISINGDTKYENDETFSVSLQSPQFANLGTKSTGVGTIINDDILPVITIQGVIVNENAGTVSLTLTKTGTTDFGSTVNYSTANGLAVAPGDFTNASGSVTFLANETTKTISIPIINDVLVETPETFTVNLSGVSGATLGNTAGTVTIVDDDATQFYVESKTVNEGAGTVTYKVFKTSNTVASVNYTVASGTAVLGTDFNVSPATGTLNFATNEASKDITVAIINDNITEPSENFTITLSNPSAGATIIAGLDVGTEIITDNDPTPVASFVPNALLVNEGNCANTTATFTVQLNNPSAQTVTVNYSTASGTATAGTDFTPASGTLTFNPGETSKTFTVTILPTDLTDEPNEDFTVTLSNPVNATLGVLTATATIQDIPNLTLNVSGTDLTCNGNNSGSITAIAGGGTPSYEYSIGGAFQTSGVFTGVAAGTYTVTARDAANCTIAQSNVVISQPTALSVTVQSSANVTCNGGTNGSILLSVTGGNGNYTYQWSNASGIFSTNKDQLALAAGTYQVIVTDGLGCNTTLSNIQITQPTALGISLAQTGATCNGSSNGSVTVTASGGTSPYSYSIDGGTAQTSATFSNQAPGGHTVTVFDANSCQVTDIITVTQPAAFSVTQFILTDPTCFGASNGSIQVVGATGGTGAIRYSVDGGAFQASSTLTGLTTGTHTVLLRDANNCTSQPFVETLTQPAAISAVTTPSDAICAGQATGSITVNNASGGSGTYQYSSNGGTTFQVSNVFSNLAAGNYNIVVRDANGCLSPVYTTTVGEPAAFTATITAGGNTALCQGDAVTLTASSGGSYAWSTGESSQSIVVNSANTYSVLVTDGSGCTATASIAVTVNQLPQVTFAKVDPSCGNSNGSINVTVTGGLSPYSYLWSSSENTSNISGKISGVYTLEVTDANGCKVTTSIPLTDQNGPTVTVDNKVDVTCNGGNNGSVNVTASGIGTLSYEWTSSNGFTSSSEDISNLLAGNYSLTVTDANGCIANSSVVINEPVAPIATISAGGSTNFCQGGSVTLTASAGTSYLWSTGATTAAITVNNSGNYSVTVTDANGCNATSAPVVVTVNPLPPTTITAGGPTTFCQGGSVTLSAPAGYSYLWSNGATTQSINVTTANNYTVTVTDANGCFSTSAATTVTVNTPPTVTITPGGPLIFCQGGSVTLTATAGSAYLWSNGAVSQSISVNASGSYSVTVTDANGCTGTSGITSVVVNVPTTPVINPNGPTTFCQGGSVLLTASAGSSYSWSNGANTQSITATTSGNYSVTVTDANGCSATSLPTAVLVNSLPTATITAGGPTTFCIGGSVTLTAPVGYTYLWSTGATTQSISATASGNYTVTIFDVNSCFDNSTPTTVTVNPLPAAPGVNIIQPTCTVGTGSITVTSPTGVGFEYSIDGTTYQSSTSFTGLTPGPYSLTTRNAQGCESAITSVTINSQLPTPAAPTASTIQPTCTVASGSITVTSPTGAGLEYSIDGTNYQAGLTFNGLTSTTYTLTVRNAQGCVSTATSVVINAQPATPAAPTATTVQPTCLVANGSITVTAPLGAGLEYSIDGTNYQAGVTFNGLTSTTYNLTVRNAQGCVSLATSVTIDAQPSTPAAPTASTVQPTCLVATGSITVTAPLGAGLEYSIDGTNYQAGLTFNGLTSTTYNLTVRNAQGCVSLATAVTIDIQPSTPVAPTATTVQPTCLVATGSITVTAPTGAGLEYSIDGTNYQAGLTFNGLTSATYTLT